MSDTKKEIRSPYPEELWISALKALEYTHKKQSQKANKGLSMKAIKEVLKFILFCLTNRVLRISYISSYYVASVAKQDTIYKLAPQFLITTHEDTYVFRIGETATAVNATPIRSTWYDSGIKAKYLVELFKDTKEI